MNLSGSLPTIQVCTPELGIIRRKFGSTGELQPLPKDIQALLDQVEKLQLETDTLHCSCNQPDCPFQQGNSPSAHEVCNSIQEDRDNYILKRQSAPAALALHQTSSGSLPVISCGLHTGMRGVQRRADGTIIECDGPGTMYSTEKRNRVHNQFNEKHLNVASFENWRNEDCQVDQENSFNCDNYKFSRQAPERRIVRISPRLQAKRQKHTSLVRKISLPSSSSFRHNQDAQRSMSMPSSYGMSRTRQISESVPSLVSTMHHHKMFSGTLREMQMERLTASA